MKNVNDIANIQDFLSAKPVKGEEKVKVKLYDYANHYFLYAKNHYITTGDMINDLKILVSHICCMEVEDIGENHIYETVWGVFRDWIEPRQKDLFMRELFRFKDDRRISRKSVISDMLSYMGLVQMVYEDRELCFTDKYDCELSK